MANLKAWAKPAIEMVRIEAAKAGAFNVTDAKHTHRSTEASRLEIYGQVKSR